MTKDRPRGLEVFRMLLEIRCRSKMAELMRRHVNADVPHESVFDLLRKSGLALPAAAPCHEDRAIHVRAQARQHVTAIPSEAPGNLVGDFTEMSCLLLFVSRAGM